MNKNYKLNLSAGRFNITQRPENPKLYTTQEVAAELNVSKSTITNIVNRYELPHTKDPTKRGLPSVFDYLTVKKIAEILQNQKEHRKTEIRTTPDLDAEAAAHPLVTNPDFLKLSYFPDVIPACFAEDGDE